MRSSSLLLCSLLFLGCNKDRDGDGFSVKDGDCDDNDSELTPEDNDGDGFSTCDGDCDDEDATVEPADLDADGFATCDGDWI